ncbi:MAG: polysaccharide deacetylase [Clostridium butyricum]|nr:polysaccharide deacetylase [Clostridium butyricum]
MKLNFFNKLVILIIIFSNILKVFPLANEISENTSESKVVYLTFDDGPAGKVTSNILDILLKENVNATFFLIGDQIKGQEDILKRMRDEGHSLGLHSMTHKKCYLYCSNDHFLQEMLETQALIDSTVNIKSNILRFPFGCNNNSYKITESMVNLLHKNNLKIYDWNVDSGDGANPNSDPSKLIKNSKSNKNHVILLMHCAYMSKNTVKALPSIIKFYKDEGYEFKTIDETTPEEFHYINK